MKTILKRLTNEQAQSEMQYLPIISIMLTTIPLFVFGFIAIAGVAISARGLLLTFRAGANYKNILQYRILFTICSVVAFIEVILYFSR